MGHIEGKSVYSFYNRQLACSVFRDCNNDCSSPYLRDPELPNASGVEFLEPGDSDFSGMKDEFQMNKV